MNKREKQQVDILTKKNKYSIRKFSVGTASIIVGSLLFLGVGNQAEAAEDAAAVAPEKTAADQTQPAAEAQPNGADTTNQDNPQPATSPDKATLPENTATRDTKTTDKIDTNDICYVGENPTAKGAGVNPADGVFVDWEKIIR
ncbi:YSIRK-type signal peptide-containing protein [Staphylococcus condimenti]|uniref:YSIRK-type signal peptide-containing protein n=1 Tax=Staphylococcus condimenti TaxID=70255 RepID=UPI0009F9BA8B|nr:YSIRK-type signal peptide-containing protein [Staphylococcus condimenti]